MKILYAISANPRRWPLLFLIFLGLLGPGLARAQGQLGTILPNARIQISPPPAGTPILEHSPISVPYVVTLLPGVGGTRPTVDLVVCADIGQSGEICDTYDHVSAPWSSPAGARLSVRSPSAGQAIDARVVVCTKAVSTNAVVSCGQPLRDNGFRLTTFARYVVALDSFTIAHTRARNKDTVYLGLMGYAGKTPGALNSCNLVLAPASPKRPVLCKGPSRFDVKALGNGTYPVDKMTVGTFDLVPGRDGPLSFAFVVFNYGFPAQAPSVLGSMTGQSQGAMRGEVTNNLKEPDRDFTARLNGAPWLGCDGPTAAGAVRFGGGAGPGSLDAATLGNGFAEGSARFQVKSQLGCGDSPDYTVHWIVRRTSWAGGN